VPTTFIALAVAVLAILPGAVFMLAYESRIGAFRVSVPDRVIRFLVASAALHAVFAGVSYRLYKDQIQSGSFAAGKASAWLVESVSLLYVVVPFLAGMLVGHLAKKPHVAKLLNGGTYHPRAWDYLFTLNVTGIFLIRLKSGRWIAAWYNTAPNGRASYASGYGEDAEVYFAQQLSVDPETGEFHLDEDDAPIVKDNGILLKWAEVEYAQFIEER
jgi:hypothetical protein